MRSLHGNSMPVAVAFAVLVLCATSSAAEGQNTSRESRSLPVQDVAFSPDGKTLAVTIGDRDGGGTIAVYGLPDGKLDFCRSDFGAPTGLAYSPTNRQLAIGNRGRELALVHLPRGNLGPVWNSRHGTVYAVAWSPDGEHLFSSGKDETVRQWDVGTGGQVRTFDTWSADDIDYPPEQRLADEPLLKSRSLTAVAVSSNGRRLLSAGWYDGTRLWDVSTGEMLLCFAKEEQLTPGVYFHPDGRHLVSHLRKYSEVLIRDLASGRAQAALRVHGNDTAMHPNGRLLAVASRRGVQLYELDWSPPSEQESARIKRLISRLDGDHVDERGQAEEELARCGLWIAPLLFSHLDHEPAEVRLRVRRLWTRVRSPDPIVALRMGSEEFRQVAFSPDGQLLAGGAAEGNVFVWRSPGYDLQVELNPTFLSQEIVDGSSLVRNGR